MRVVDLLNIWVGNTVLVPGQAVVAYSRDLNVKVTCHRGVLWGQDSLVIADAGSQRQVGLMEVVQAMEDAEGDEHERTVSAEAQLAFWRNQQLGSLSGIYEIRPSPGFFPMVSFPSVLPMGHPWLGSRHRDDWNVQGFANCWRMRDRTPLTSVGFNHASATLALVQECSPTTPGAISLMQVSGTGLRANSFKPLPIPIVFAPGSAWECESSEPFVYSDMINLSAAFRRELQPQGRVCLALIPATAMSVDVTKLHEFDIANADTGVVRVWDLPPESERAAPETLWRFTEPDWSRLLRALRTGEF